MDSTESPKHRLNVTRGFDLALVYTRGTYHFTLEENAKTVGTLDVLDADALLVAGRGFFWFKGNAGLELLLVQSEVDVRWNGGNVGRLDKAALQSVMKEAANAAA